MPKGHIKFKDCRKSSFFIKTNNFPMLRPFRHISICPNSITKSHRPLSAADFGTAIAHCMA